MKSVLKKTYPHLIAVILFLIIPLIYFTPVLEGKKIQQLDVIKAQGMQQELKEYYEETGETALWTNSMFGGMPSYQIIVLGASKNNIFERIYDFVKFTLPNYSVDIVFLYLIGFYVFLVLVGVNPWLSIAGAFAFAFSSYNFIIIEAGHVNKAFAIALMPPIVGGVIAAYRGKYFTGFIATMIALGAHISFGHLQMTYYLLITLAIYAILKLVNDIRNRRIHQFITATAILLGAAILAILPNTTRLWTTWEYSQETIRGGSDLASAGPEATGLDKEYAMAWSYGTWETFTLLIPNFHGGASSGSLSENSNTYKALLSNGVPAEQARQFIQQVPTYWGDQPFTAGPTYFGAIIVFLFIVGLFLIKGNVKWWALTATLLSILLAWGENFIGFGNPFTNLFFEYVPFYNKFRAVASILVIASVTVPALAFLCAKQLLDKNINKREKQKALNYGLYIAGGLSLFFILFGGMLFDFESASDAQLLQGGYPEWLVNALQKDRAGLLRADAFRSLIFILLGFASLWALINQKMKNSYAIAILALLVLIDLWAVDKRYLNNDDFKPARRALQIEPTQANLQILKDRDSSYRVFNLTANPFTESYTSYFHQSIGGYHGAKLSRYQDLIERHLSQRNMDVLNMLNTRYFIVPGENNQPAVRRNPDALGNAWFVDSVRIVEDANAEIEALNDFDPRTTAVVDRRFEDYISDRLGDMTPGEASSDSIVLSDYRPDRLTYKSSSAGDRLAVFSEIYYNDEKGWNAFIDGKPVPHIRVNYVLRALAVPAGEHTIEFRFEPRSFYTGQTISLIGSILAGLSIIGFIFVKARRASKPAVPD